MSSDPPAGPERGDILGVRVSCVDMQEAVETIESWIAKPRGNYVTVTPAHVVMDARRSPRLRGILNASGMTTPDGMAIVWILRLQGHRRVRRVYGPDLMLAVCRHGVGKGWRHFLYGGDPAFIGGLASRLTELSPGLKVAGFLSPPYRDLAEEEDRAIVEQIRSTAPDVVWVGLGSPRQELWMSEHSARLGSSVLIGVGAAFDFLSGRKRQAPRWMQRSGLEWLFRLASEPTRLWPRYREYPLFLVLVAAQMLGLRVVHDPGAQGRVQGRSGTMKNE